MSSLTLRISDSVNWDDLVGVRPQFGLKVVAITRLSAASPRYPRALSGQALVSECVSCAQAGSPLDPIHVWQAVGPVEYS